jgi:hypothetical protein
MVASYKSGIVERLVMGPYCRGEDQAFAVMALTRARATGTATDGFQILVKKKQKDHFTYIGGALILHSHINIKPHSSSVKAELVLD